MLLLAIPGEIQPLQLKVGHVIPAGKPVRGVTLLGDQLFVVRYPCRQQIEVYDATTLAVQHHLSVPDFHQPCGLASCAVNSCLYATDYYGNTVHRVHLAVTSSRDSATTTSWRVTGRPVGISVTQFSRNVLVACCSLLGKNRLKEYTSDGTQVRKIRLQPDLRNCCHAIQVANPADHFVISHGGDQWGLAGEAAGRVSLVNADGRIVRSFVDKRFPVSLSPGQLAIGKVGCVLVADQKRGRLLLLGSSLVCSRDMVVDGGLKGPYALCYDESHGRLYVGEVRGGRVLVVTNINM